MIVGVYIVRCDVSVCMVWGGVYGVVWVCIVCVGVYMTPSLHEHLTHLFFLVFPIMLII